MEGLAWNRFDPDNKHLNLAMGGILILLMIH
jgi:hypothetical protein